MKCDYCLEEFDEYLKIPIKLRCSHNFCNECVEYLRHMIVFCPLDKQKLDYKHSEVNEEIMNEIKFVCSSDGILCIGICFDHCLPICEICIDSHSDCEIFKGTRKEISNSIKAKYNLASVVYADYRKEESSPSILKNNEIVENVVNYLKSLDESLVKFENNLLNQEEIQEFLGKIKFESKTGQKKMNQNENSLLLENTEIESLMKILQSSIINLPNYESIRDDKIESELKILNSGYLAYFRKMKINGEEYNKYFCNFMHTFKDFVFVYGCGIGLPSNQNSSIYISYFEVTVNETKFTKEIGILDFIPDRITSEIYFEEPVIFPMNEKMYFHIEIEGAGNYLFKTLETDRVTIKDLGDNLYLGNFPVLYLLIV